MGVHLSREDAKRFGITDLPPRPNKYRAVKEEYGGCVYDSKAEASRAKVLDTLKAMGQIRGWVRQVTFVLGVPENRYRVDFVVFGITETWAEDVKGVSTAKFKRDIKLWRAYAPISLRIIRNGKVAEVIQPKAKAGR
jgi:hypothetical protein